MVPTFLIETDYGTQGAEEAMQAFVEAKTGTNQTRPITRPPGISPSRWCWEANEVSRAFPVGRGRIR
jgi:hypothetical protein